MDHTEAKHHNREDLEGFAGEDAPWMWGIVVSMILILIFLGTTVLVMF